MGSHCFPFLSALLKPVSTGTLVGAQRGTHLIDSARLPRQPWFPVATFTERWWLRWVSIAPAVLSSSSSSVSLNAPYPFASRTPWRHGAERDKRGREIGLAPRGWLWPIAMYFWMWEHMQVCFRTHTQAHRLGNNISCDCDHIHLEEWCHFTWEAFTINTSPNHTQTHTQIACKGGGELPFLSFH